MLNVMRAQFSLIINKLLVVYLWCVVYVLAYIDVRNIPLQYDLRMMPIDNFFCRSGSMHPVNAVSFFLKLGHPFIS